jgi:hypothetical protein
MFPYVGGPAYDIIQPTAGQVFHVGDSLVVQWYLNPRAAANNAALSISLDASKSWRMLISEMCWLIWVDSLRAGTPCILEFNYPAWAYVVRDGKYLGTWKCKISNPISTPDPYITPFNPISDSVVIKILDRHGGYESDSSEIFSIKP